MLTLHEVGKGIFYMRNVPKSHEECNACPQFRVFALYVDPGALPSKTGGGGSGLDWLGPRSPRALGLGPWGVLRARGARWTASPVGGC
jgi:hypothetical protein